MPIYEYRCNTCGAECNEIRCIDNRENAPDTCYRCGRSDTMQFMVSPVKGIVKNPAAGKSDVS